MHDRPANHPREPGIPFRDAKRSRSFSAPLWHKQRLDLTDAGSRVKIYGLPFDPLTRSRPAEGRAAETVELAALEAEFARTKRSRRESLHYRSSISFSES